MPTYNPPPVGFYANPMSGYNRDAPVQAPLPGLQPVQQDTSALASALRTPDNKQMGADIGNMVQSLIPANWGTQGAFGTNLFQGAGGAGTANVLGPAAGSGAGTDFSTLMGLGGMGSVFGQSTGWTGA
jgi:hypothetical protein